MANWTNKLELKDLWEQQKEGKLTIPELGKMVAKRIRNMKCYKKEIDILEDIANQFEYVENDVEEFDGILEELYDWGDECVFTLRGEMQKKKCWINTF